MVAQIHQTTSCRGFAPRGRASSHANCVMTTKKEGMGFPRLEKMTGNTPGKNPNQDDDDNSTGLATKTRPKVKKPSLYRVLLLNDDYTPMEFVVHVLEKFFNKGQEEATQIMLLVHQNGVGICGTFTYEVAETKVTQVIDAARRNQHPLQCTMEKE